MRPRGSIRATGSGTVTPSQLAFPYLVNWGYPERFHQRQSRRRAGSSRASRARPASSRAIARVVRTVDEFDEVRDGDILVCQMTNPAWVVLFTKIAGLVTDTGGTTSHPAVLAREFGIPAVIGTSVATQRIATGDRVQGRRDGRPGRDPARRTGRGRGRPGVRDRALSGPPHGHRQSRSRAASSPTRSRSGSSRTSSTATTRRTRGSSRRRSRASSGRARRRSARRSAGSRRSGSWRSRRSAAPASGARHGSEILEAYVVRSTLESLGARLAVPRLTDADLAELTGHLERCAPRPATTTATAWPRRTRASTAGSSSSPTTPTLVKVWRSLEPFSRTYLTLVVPGADPRWSAELPCPDPRRRSSARRRRGGRRARAALRRGQCEHGAPLAG